MVDLIYNIVKTAELFAPELKNVNNLNKAPEYFRTLNI
jgi:hypothetical protein